MKLINRYLFKEILLFFLFFIASFYFLYVLIDYSMHLKLFHQEKLSYIKIGSYYLWQFTQRIDILFPLALMIASIKILTTMNLRLELVALLASGIPFKQLFRPFLWIACGVSLFLYFNQQWFQPYSFSYIKNFEQNYLKKKDDFSSPVYSLHLPNNVLLLYQNFDQEKKEFKNVFLVTNLDDICRIETLTITEKGMLGRKVDRLSRKSSGEIAKKESLESELFPKMEINEKTLFNETKVTRAQSMFELVKKIPKHSFGAIFKKINDKDAENLSYFSYKLFLPLLSLLAVIAPAPFCIRYSRKIPLIFIFAGALFSIFAFFILINSCLVLSIHQILPPFWGICIPFLLLFSFFGYRHAKL